LSIENFSLTSELIGSKRANAAGKRDLAGYFWRFIQGLNRMLIQSLMGESHLILGGPGAFQFGIWD